jgi:hypothetical protein
MGIMYPLTMQKLNLPQHLGMKAALLWLHHTGL